MNEPSAQLHELILQLGQLEFLERYQARELAKTQQWIIRKQKEIEQQQARDARAAQPPPAWLIQHGIGAGPVTVHTNLTDTADQCWATAGRERCHPATRDQALQALTSGGQACEICRPDTALGILD
ncbi:MULTISPECIES: DUF6233 domain-containing protein [unclassified Streptomyces]|uniref:DUF6233 domain-containing protein n=1 Tax=unclassified Streptomyces TaxID=2593676 RepID=UPI0033D1F076